MTQEGKKMEIKYLYQDEKQTPENRAQDLIARMNLEEKINQLSGEIVMDQIPEGTLGHGIGELVVYMLQRVRWRKPLNL